MYTLDGSEFQMHQCVFVPIQCKFYTTLSDLEFIISPHEFYMLLFYELLQAPTIIRMGFSSSIVVFVHENKVENYFLSHIIVFFKDCWFI
jgi:hypothetical protein